MTTGLTIRQVTRHVTYVPQGTIRFLGNNASIVRHARNNSQRRNNSRLPTATFCLRAYMLQSSHCAVSYMTLTAPYGTSPPESHLGRAHRYPSRQRMHSSTACANCAVSTADKSSYSATGTLHLYHSSPLTHRSLTVIFTITLTLLTVLICYNCRLVFYRLECSSQIRQG